MNVSKKIGPLVKIPAFILLAGILFSCVNDLDSIQKVSYDPNAPSEVTKDLHVLYSDSGYARVDIFASLAETYRSPKHITKLREGLSVDFYSLEGEIVSKLTAQYGEIDYTTGLIMVKDSVVLRNIEKKQSLQTEELFWNQNDSTIFTEKNVLITTEGKGITGRGKGLRTTQSFSKYVISNPIGQLNISEE